MTTSRRILVVDDNVDGADMAAELLQGHGHVTQVAYSAEAAVVIASSFQPEVALLDVHLPQMGGYELARRLRATLLLSCRFVAVTGSASRDDLEKSAAAGFHFHLAKPFGIQALLDAVDGDGSGVSGSSHPGDPLGAQPESEPARRA